MREWRDAHGGMCSKPCLRRRSLLACQGAPQASLPAPLRAHAGERPSRGDNAQRPVGPVKQEGMVAFARRLGRPPPASWHRQDSVPSSRWCMRYGSSSEGLPFQRTKPGNQRRQRNLHTKISRVRSLQCRTPHQL